MTDSDKDASLNDLAAHIQAARPGDVVGATVAFGELTIVTTPASFDIIDTVSCERAQWGGHRRRSMNRIERSGRNKGGKPTSTFY